MHNFFNKKTLIHKATLCFILLLCSFAISQSNSELNEEIIETELEEVKEIRTNYTDSLNRLRLYSFENQILAYDNVNNKRLVTYSDGKLRRLYYDKDDNLIRIEYWVIGKEIEKAKITKITTFTYTNSKINSCTETDFNANTQNEIKYNALKKIIERTKYEIQFKTNQTDSEKKLNTTTETTTSESVTETEPVIIKTPSFHEPEIETKKRVCTYHYSYDSRYRVTEERIDNYFESHGKTLVINQRNVYRYLKVNVTPDFYYYENSVLRLKRNYSSNEDYTETVFFDSDKSIITEYKKSKRIYSIFMVGNEETYKKVYD